MEKFIRELRAAKNRGVNVSKIFVEDEERLALMHTKTFGLRLAILWVFFAPVALVAFEAYCIERGLQVSVPHDLVYWTCGMGFVSILAFGFDLVDLSTLWRGVVRFIRPMPVDNPTDEADGDV